jgi:mRNA interferase MazF
MEGGGPVILRRGSVVLVELDPTVGNEKRGVRPCVVVSDPVINEDQRFPVLCVVPVTGTLGVGALYPQLSPSGSGLTKVSCALVDHVRSIDKRRIRRVYGVLPASELAALDEALRLFLGLRGAR